LEPLVDFARGVALRHNFVPSLHVTLSVVCIAVYARRAGTAGKALLWAWSAFIGVSTLLLHQHYVVDVLAGYALGMAGVRHGYRRWMAASEPAPAGT
jgi:membrane-associated phospholipid phosphatase